MKVKKKLHLSQTMDILFINLAIFALVFIWTRVKTKFWTSLFMSTISTMCVWAILKIRSNKKKAGQLEPSLVTHMQECINQLMLNLPSQTLDFFVQLLQKKLENVTKHEQCILVKHNEITTAVFNFILPGKLTEEQLCSCFCVANSLSAQKILILSAHGQTIQTKTLAAHLPLLKVDIYKDTQVYNMMRAFNHYPTIILKLKQSVTPNKLTLIKSAVAPKNAKRYLILSFVFIIYAYFFGNATYYLVFACIAICFSIACRLKLVEN
ncbi:MAG: hypothetical protein LBU60_06495 [Clostridiales bacterium]|jgi:hypothetical protein|nr:hypothetical protein [Clostridiales bacterium]